jgi:hypothetical protein
MYTSTTVPEKTSFTALSLMFWCFLHREYGGGGWWWWRGVVEGESVFFLSSGDREDARREREKGRQSTWKAGLGSDSTSHTVLERRRNQAYSSLLFCGTSKNQRAHERRVQRERETHGEK